MMADETVDTTFKSYIGVVIEDIKQAQKRLAASSCAPLVLPVAEWHKKDFPPL